MFANEHFKRENKHQTTQTKTKKQANSTKPKKNTPTPSSQTTSGQVSMIFNTLVLPGRAARTSGNGKHGSTARDAEDALDDAEEGLMDSRDGRYLGSRQLLFLSQETSRNLLGGYDFMAVGVLFACLFGLNQLGGLCCSFFWGGGCFGFVTRIQGRFLKSFVGLEERT